MFPFRNLGLKPLLIILDRGVYVVVCRSVGIFVIVSENPNPISMIDIAVCRFVSMIFMSLFFQCIARSPAKIQVFICRLIALHGYL